MSGLSEDTQALLNAARDGDEPSVNDRARVRAAIARRIALGAAAGAAVATASHVAGGATSAAAGAAGTACAAAGTVATTSIAAGAVASAVGGGAATAVMTGLGAKILVSVAIVGAVSAGTVTYANHEAARKAAPTVSVVAAPAVAVAPAPRPALPVRPSAIAAPTTAPAEPLVPVAPAPTVAAAPTPPSPAPAAAPTTSPLDAELALLQEAHAALRAGEGERALRLYADHARRFPSGQLGEEAEAGRVFALCEVGRVDEARDVAGRFLREHPRSPLGPRVARACEDAPATFRSRTP